MNVMYKLNRNASTKKNLISFIIRRPLTTHLVRYNFNVGKQLTNKNLHSDEQTKVNAALVYYHSNYYKNRIIEYLISISN